VGSLTLEQGERIARGTLEAARAEGFKPLTVAVLDAGGTLKVLLRDDGSDILRPDIAIAKAWGALGLGISSRAIAEMAAERPHFVGALTGVAAGRGVPAAGGVPVRGEGGDVARAVGASGDVSDNHEGSVLRGIESAGRRTA